MLGDADGDGAGGFACSTPARSRSRGAGRTAARRRAELRLLVPAAQERAGLVGVRRAQRLRAGLRHRRRGGGPLRAAAPLLEPRGAAPRADPRPRRGGAAPARGALAARPRRRAGLRRRGRWRATSSASTAPTASFRRRAGDRGRQRGARGLAAAGRRAGRSSPTWCSRWTTASSTSRTGCTATCANTTSRSRQPEADGPALARRPARQAERRRPRPERRTADDPALARRAPALRHELALLELGQPVLPGAALVAAEGQLRTRTAGWRSTATSSSTSMPVPTGRREPTRCASRAATARPRSSNDRAARTCRRHPDRGDARVLGPGAPPGRRSRLGEAQRTPSPPAQTLAARPRDPSSQLENKEVVMARPIRWTRRW